jgi:hypothetical protein
MDTLVFAALAVGADAATIESRIISVHDAMASVRSMARCRAAFPPRTPGRTDELADIASVLVATDSPTEQELMEQLRAEFETTASANGNGSANGSGSLNGNAQPSSVEAEPAGAADAFPDHDVLVRLLGDITIEGGQPLKPKATAVVAYVALNRSVTTARLQEACWFSSDGSPPHQAHPRHDGRGQVSSRLAALPGEPQRPIRGRTEGSH